MFNKSRDTNYNPNDNTNPTLILARWTAWTLLIHPVGIAASILMFWVTVKLGLRARWVLGLPPLTLIAESILLRGQIGPRWLVMWANAFRFRRDWFGIWTDTVTHKDDHSNKVFGLAPLLGLFPSFDGSIISWTLRPAKGETMEYFAQFADVMATHSFAVESVNIIYNNSTSKKGLLRARFPQKTTVSSVVETLKEDTNEFA